MIETSYDQFKNDINWSLARVPNINELITMSYPLAIANMTIEPFIERLYQINPIAKAVIRDWTKIPPNIAAWWNGNEIGGTHIKYDEGNIYGDITKIICKSSIVGIYANINHGAAEGSTKNTVADQVGSFFGQLGAFPFLKTIYVTIENKFISVTVDAIAGGDLLYSKNET